MEVRGRTWGVKHSTLRSDTHHCRQGPYARPVEDGYGSMLYSTVCTVQYWFMDTLQGLGVGRCQTRCILVSTSRRLVANKLPPILTVALVDFLDGRAHGLFDWTATDS